MSVPSRQPTQTSTPSGSGSCERCAALELERDAVLAELAKERELTNALRLAAFGPGRGLPPLPEYPAPTGPGAPPLRYVLADQLNERFKTVFSVAHRAGRELLSRAKGRRG